MSGGTLLSALLLVASSSLGAARDQKASDAAAPLYDCGTLALYNLLYLEGRRTDLRRLESVLPSPEPRGYSMKELQSAARACGLNLGGAALGRDDRAIDRPMIVFVRQEGHGHFIVIRPVGHTGRLVQVIDRNRAPDVLDKSDLYSSDGWTGLALIPRRYTWTVPVGWGLAACAVFLGLRGSNVVRRLVQNVREWSMTRSRSSSACASGRARSSGDRVPGTPYAVPRRQPL